MEIKLVISYPDGKTEQKELKGEEAEKFIGFRLGESFDGKSVGLSDSLIITGGSDKDGFPMKKGVYGSRREKLLLSGGIGYHPKDEGVRRKKRVRGDTITEEIVQINTKVAPKKKAAPKKRAAKLKEAELEEAPKVEEMPPVEEVEEPQTVEESPENEEEASV
ncbi:MAG: 30S ribosomal protein S6e [Candidatus Methanofastidiosa archaeon]|nr:30S ribosomal protein S6e [Candidatus Methanofastidiosa archaeon]